MHKILATSLSLLLFMSASLSAAVKTETILYKHGKTICEGYLAYDVDNRLDVQRPGVLIVHEWMGLGDHVKESARKLAEMGYVAFAADIYGKGVRAKNVEEAKTLSSLYKNDRKLMRARVLAGLDALRKNKLVDPLKLAAIGYCFGGTTVLELARSGAVVNGVVSFHGGLGTPNPEDTKNLKGKILVLHGADDPYVPQSEIDAFVSEMKSSGADWQMNYYSGAVHSFTNPAAGNDNSKGAAYNEQADKRSWADMKNFIEEIFQ